MIRLAAVITLAAALLSTVPGQAAPFTPELEADYAAALAWWGVSSPPQCASVTEELLPTDPFRDRDGVVAAMRATQPAPDEVGAECHLYGLEDGLNSLSPCAREMEMRHEVGHLRGLAHSEDPSDIMHAPFSMAVWCPADAAAAQATVDALVIADNRDEIAAQEWAAWREWRSFCRERRTKQARCFGNVRKAAAHLRDLGY